MNYEQCLRYLEKIQNLGIKFGLDNVRTILYAFDNPHLKYPSVLVAGTNGKGSVCAMLTQILTLHGFSAGLFTSPHLVCVEERIRIGKRKIARRSFCKLLTALRAKIEELIVSRKLLSPPTYFEMLTCLAFLFFKEQKVDMAFLEIGMGGRFDATNVVKPSVSVITTISAEHQKFLGDSLNQIAFEKAGIVKPGVPVVCGVEVEEAYKTIKKRAKELEAPFFGVFARKSCFKKQKTGKGYAFEYNSGREKYSYRPSLPGEHQGKNAAVAIACALQLSNNWKKLEKEKIILGIETTRWDGRLEVISRRPLVLLDGAHNEEGARALEKYVREFVPAPVILVYAAMQDKKIEKIAEILFPLAGKVILTRFPYFRAEEPDEMKDRLQGFKDRIVCEPDARKAFEMAIQSAGARGSILITGSLFLVGEIKKFIKLNVVSRKP